MIRYILLRCTFSIVSGVYADNPMAQRDYISNPRIGGGSEMATSPLRKAKKHLVDGGKLYARGLIQDVHHYATIMHGPEDHERANADGALLLVSIDISSIFPGNWRWAL